MADLTPQDMASKLLVEGFARSGGVADALSDPIAETPMVVTLDDLRPYELNPRLTRNPNHDNIKASIRERGLDVPPPISRRPGANHYIILSGGNTRLTVLRELWSETKDERFFRIHCLYRPWPGDLIALSGHLVESDLHSPLTFIERALGIEKMRELYEQDGGKPLSQSELARRLAANGYPVPQPHISRMQDTIHHLLPCMPNVLFGGLGRHQASRLVALRNAAEATWHKHANDAALPEFAALFHDLLMVFDTQPDAFVVERVQDELIGQMAKLLGVHYNVLELDIGAIEQRQQAVPTSPPTSVDIVAPRTVTATEPITQSQRTESPAANTQQTNQAEPQTSPRAIPQRDATDAVLPQRTVEANASQVLQDHIVSPAASTERLDAIQQLVAEHAGEEPPPRFEDQALRAIPVQAGGLFPISDVWYIEPAIDSPERLRIHIAQFAREIAAEADLTDRIGALNAGIGFTCAPVVPNLASAACFERTVWALLRELSVHYETDPTAPDETGAALNNTLGGLLVGSGTADNGVTPRLSDNGLVKLFRLIRLARRLLDLEAIPDTINH